MAQIFIILILLLALTFWVTRVCIIKIIKDRVFTVEFHFIFFAIVLTERKRRKNGRHLPSFYIDVFKRISQIAPLCEIEINELSIKREIPEFERKAFTMPYRYHTAISAALAYLGEKAQKLTVNENKVVLSSQENPQTKFNITIRIMLFHLLSQLAKWLIRFIKRKRRKEVY